MLEWGQTQSLRIAGQLLSPGGRAGRLLILTYHRVLAEPDPLMPDCIDARVFDMQMSVVKKIFCVQPLRTAVDQIESGSLPPRALSITFDDGYADNYEVALPILQKHGLTATLFVATDFLNGGRMWNDTIIEVVRNTDGVLFFDDTEVGRTELPVSTLQEKRVAVDVLIGKLKHLPPAQRQQQVALLSEQAKAPLSNTLMLTSKQLVALSEAGIEIGGHTVSHPILSRLTADEAVREIDEGRNQLRELTSTDVVGFAYPNGRPDEDYTQAHVNAVRKAGFSYAVSTAQGCSQSGMDLYQLPRFGPWDTKPLRFGLRLISQYTKGKCALA